MTTSSTNLGLTLFNSTTDATSQTFLQYRTAMAGTAVTSNLNKIDVIFGIIKVDTSLSRVGIGTAGLPTVKLELRESVSLGTTLGAYQPVTKIGGSTASNSIYNDLYILRDTAGADWITARFHDSVSVDSVYRTPGVDTKVWWERDPYNSIQSWGTASTTWMTLNAGKLGIGTATPSYTFQVGANAGQAFSITDLVGSVRIGINVIPQSGAALTVYITPTEITSSITGGAYGCFSNPPSDSGLIAIGVSGTARSSSSAFNYPTGFHVGGYFNAVHQGSGTMAGAYGAYVYVSNTSTGILSNATGIFILGSSSAGGGTITATYGLYISNQTVGTTSNHSIYTNSGLVHFGDSVDLSSGKNITFIAGNIATDTTTGTKIGTATNQKLGFWNSTPIVKPSAFTQTYATTAKTLTQTTMTDPVAYVTGANGYSTTAMAQAIHAEVIALRANMIVTQNVLNAVIDDLQLMGLLA